MRLDADCVGTPTAGSPRRDENAARAPQVAVDGGLFARTHFGGAVRYLTGLIEGLLQLGCQVTVVLDRPVRQPATHLPASVRWSPTRPLDADVWLTGDASSLAEPDAHVRTVLIVHDVMPWEPGLTVPRESAGSTSRSDMELALGHADLVLTVSHATRDRIGAVFPTAQRSRIVVAPHAVALARAPAPATGRTSTVLHVGGRDGYKRFDLLLGAFAGLCSRHPATLVTVGGRRELSDAERDIVARLGLDGAVLSLGYVSDNELAALYSCAQIVAMPSDAEGYGVPLLEALAAEVPIVAADLPVVREVTEGTAITFDKGDVRGAAAALIRAWEDPPARGDLEHRAGVARSWRWRDAGAVLLDGLAGLPTPATEVARQS